jgi:hypothetical protein
MRSYLIDEISKVNMEKIDAHLMKHAVRSGIEKLFWVKIPDDILTDVQYQHQDCRPHVFAVELGTDWMKLELFVRSLKGFRCRCSSYCSSPQRDFIFNYADQLIETLEIQT